MPWYIWNNIILESSVLNRYFAFRITKEIKDVFKKATLKCLELEKNSDN